jgi:hypothetical protein
MKQLFLAACTYGFGKLVSYNTCLRVFMEMLPILLQHHIMFLLKECMPDVTSLIRSILFLISNFCHVLNVVFFLLGNSLVSEFYVLSGCKVRMQSR